MKRIHLAIGAAAALAIGTYVSGNDDPWGFKRVRIESAVASQLRDPASAEFRNWRSGSNVTCGEVNGRNAFGAYAGFTEFVYKNGDVQFAPESDLAKDVLQGKMPVDIAGATVQLNEVTRWAKLSTECYQ